MNSAVISSCNRSNVSAIKDLQGDIRKFSQNCTRQLEELLGNLVHRAHAFSVSSGGTRSSRLPALDEIKHRKH